MNHRRFHCFGRFAFSAWLAVLASSYATAGESYPPGWSQVRTQSMGSESLNYILYVPNVQPGVRYPLVIHLHGNSGGPQELIGNSPILRTLSDAGWQTNNPCFILGPACPQTPTQPQWVNTPWANGSYSITNVPISISMQLVLAIVDDLCTNHVVDPDRLYMTGGSMGGYGAWDSICRFPDRFAAAIPLSGGGDPSRAPFIKDVPVHAYHIKTDPIVPVAASREMIAAIRAAGGQPLYTQFADGGHLWDQVWDPTNATYWQPGLLPWLFQQKRADVAINEIMYHPPDNGSNDNTQAEYIELYNPAAVPVRLQDTNGAWRLEGGVEFTFPTNATIPAGGTIILVNFNPTNGPSLNTFLAAYNLAGAPVPIFGPYTGTLSNTSARLTLKRPVYPGIPGDPDSWIVVDDVTYTNQSPWPTNCSGAGKALQRFTIRVIGNQSTNWVGALPSPGSPAGAMLDRDGDAMSDAYEYQYGLDPDNPLDAALDLDNDGLSNAQEYLCGTNPRDASSALRFDWVGLAPDEVLLRFTAVANHSYTVQVMEPDSYGIWGKLADVTHSGSTQPIEIPASTTNHLARLYRLVTPSTP
jgi:predicted esterase